MNKNNKILIFLFVIAVALFSFTPLTSAYEGTIVLCYHDVPKEVDLDNYGADQRSFIDTIEYFKTHGYTFISLDDLIQAKNGKKNLPEKTILLTFDDAYESFYDFVYPVLKEYKISSTLAVVSSWIDGETPEYVKHKLMTWSQIREVAGSPYVDVVAHSDNLHRGIPYNPQGNKFSAAVSREFDVKTGVYEDEEDYRHRIYTDLKKSKDILEEKTGQKIRAIVWPYGVYNGVTVEQAKKAGFEVEFTLNDQVVSKNRFDQINRFLIYQNPTVVALLQDLKLTPGLYAQSRIVQVDLDMIHDPDPEQTERNLGAFLDRIKDLRVTTVYLQAFSDVNATGNISEVYFPNRVLPVRQDLFNRVVHQLKSRTGVKVYAWMPMLSLVLPDDVGSEDLFVREFFQGETRVTSSWYRRLSPFSPKVKELLTMLYEDLAVYTSIDGIVLQDDGYLNDEEDFHPKAIEEYKSITGDGDLVDPDWLSSEQENQWAQLKVEKLNELSEHLLKTVEWFRPEIKSARTLYAPVVFDTSAVERFAQDYRKSLELYDHVVIMAYPYLEEAKNPKKWFKELVAIVEKHPQGIEKTVFKIQTYDWKKEEWIKDEVLNQWLEVLVASGARHVAYYPDDYVQDHPKKEVIRTMMSVEDFPFERDWK